MQESTKNVESRLALYRRGEVRSLLGWTINGHEKIAPTLTGGGYTYPEINNLLELTDSTSLMEELSQHLLYHKTIVDMQSACPQCGSSKAIYNSYFCPFCKSHELRRGSLIEHYACKHVDFSENFARGDSLVCPKCQGTLRSMGTDFRRINNTFRCNSCRRDFSVPSINHLCAICQNTFTCETAILTLVYTYKFNEDLRQEVMANCIVELPVVNLLKEKGFKVESPGTMKGKSDIEYLFDVIATKDHKNIVFLIATHTREVGQEVVIGFFAKIYDCKPDKSVIVAIPRLSAEALRLASLYRIEVFEGADFEGVLKKLQSAIA